jgi:deoxyribonuclease IV
MTPHQRVGLHVSAAGGVANAPESAKREFDAECFQFFSRSPRGGGAPEITTEDAQLFHSRCREYGYESYIHTPYYVNFASKSKRIYHGSVNVVREELGRGSQLGVKYVVTHTGSAKDFVTAKQSIATPTEALKQVVKGLKEVFAGNPKFSSRLLLEIAAGAGSVIGDTFEELRFLLQGLGRKDVHVCLDTCHLFASGYDIRTLYTLNQTMKQFRTVLGLSQLKLVHVNDSKADLNGRADRHEHIGKGKIGEAGFKALLKHRYFQKVNFILETKHDRLIRNDLSFLKKHRKVK